MTIYYTGTTDLNISGFNAIDAYCQTFLVNTCGWTAGALTNTGAGNANFLANTVYRKYTAPLNLYSIYLLLDQTTSTHITQLLIEPTGRPIGKLADAGKGFTLLRSIIVGEDYIVFFSNTMNFQGGLPYYLSYLGRVKPLSEIIDPGNSWGMIGIGDYSYVLIGSLWKPSGTGLGSVTNPYLGLGTNPVIGKIVFTDIILSESTSDVCLGKLKGCFNGAKSSQNFSVITMKNAVTGSNARTCIILPINSINSGAGNSSSIAVQII